MLSAVLLTLSLGLIAGAEKSAVAMHTSCNPVLGGPGDDLLDGTSSCDEMWGYGGNDTVWAYAGNDHANTASQADILHMGDGNDEARMGANDLDSQDVTKAGAGGDQIYDHEAGGDWDLACGGEQQDFIYITDGDGRDVAHGGTNLYSSGDQDKQDNCDCAVSADNDSWHPDGQCPV